MAIEGMRLVLATLRIIAVLQPTYWVIENPRGRLRSLDLLAGIQRDGEPVRLRHRPAEDDRPLRGPAPIADAGTTMPQRRPLSCSRTEG